MCRPEDALPPHLLPHTPPVRATRIVQTPVSANTTTTSPIRGQSPVDGLPKVEHHNGL